MNANSAIENLDRDALSTVSRLARNALLLEAAIKQQTHDLKETEETLRRITEEALPVAMLELGLTSVTLDDGSSIMVEDSVHVGIPKPKEADAFEWLREHELGDVIKNEVTASYGKGEDGEATALIASLREAGVTYKQRESVHPGTLKALAKEKLVAGDPLPEDLFGVHIINRAIIKRT